jgi:heterodisulfide reductase subunit C
MENQTEQLLRPRVALPERLINANLTVTACFQCRKCSGGCPLTFAMDLLPHHVIRLALLGQEESVFGSKTIWVCSGCQTCTTRCPNGIDIAGVMDWLKEAAVKQGSARPDGLEARFHRLFLESLRDAGGRVPETKLLRRYTLFRMRRQPDFAELKQNLGLGWKLWKRRRVRLLGPSPLRGKGEITEIFRQAEF